MQSSGALLGIYVQVLCEYSRGPVPIGPAMSCSLLACE